MRTLAASLRTLVVVLQAACFSAPRDEVARLLSPDGDVLAILFETNGGATTSFDYLVYVCEVHSSIPGEWKVASFYAAQRSEQAYGVNLKWASPSVLVIEYLFANRADLQRPRIEIAHRTVSVMLRDGIRDPTAPPGGMLHN